MRHSVAVQKPPLRGANGCKRGGKGGFFPVRALGEYRHFLSCPLQHLHPVVGVTSYLHLMSSTASKPTVATGEGEAGDIRPLAQTTEGLRRLWSADASIAELVFCILSDDNVVYVGDVAFCVSSICRLRHVHFQPFLSAQAFDSSGF